MHARDLLEMAVLVTAHAPWLVGGPGTLEAGKLDAYWLASKCRFDRWGHDLRQARQVQQLAESTRQGYPPGLLRGLFEEIFSAEVLTRVWTAAIVAHDQRRGRDESAAVVRSIWLAHLEIRRRALELLVRHEAVRLEEAVVLNRLRRRGEFWSDMLLASMGIDEAASWGASPERVRRLSRTVKRSVPAQALSALWASLRGSFRQVAAVGSPNSDLNTRIATSILAALPLEDGYESGLLPSLWMMRLAATTTDTQLMIDQWLMEEGEDAPQAAHGWRLER